MPYSEANKSIKQELLAWDIFGEVACKKRLFWKIPNRRVFGLCASVGSHFQKHKFFDCTR